MVGFVPLSYNLRSLMVRRSATLLTVFSIAATVGVLSGVLALQQGFQTLFTESGRDDVVVFLRPGATSEGESGIRREQVEVLKKTLPEVALDGAGRPLAAGETYLAVRLRKADGGETNVPIRGVQAESVGVHGDSFRILEGELFRLGQDELIVGEKLLARVRDAQLGEVLLLNTTPFRVVGTFGLDGPYASEIWGDVERLMAALERPVFQRVVARVRPGTDLEDLAQRMAQHPQVPVRVQSERQYLAAQTSVLSGILLTLGAVLGVVLGTAAVFTATNTMLAALSARTHEIGILLATGFRPFPIFLSFLFEALVLGLLGGLLGAAAVLPLSGIETGTTNSNTFTEVAFAFRVTPTVLASAITFALALGLLAGAWPAWRAARMRPIDALRSR
jgi:putative ABC transport system permease protein